MDYQKFLQDIQGIKFAPELAQTIQDFLNASAKKAIDHDIDLIKRRIRALPTSLKNDQDQEAIDVLRVQLQTEQRDLEKQSTRLKDKLPEHDIDLTQLPPNFITQFAGPFRNIKHLQSTLMNAPTTIKRYEGEFILALLANIKTQEELQIQLEDLTDEALTELIRSSTATYERAQLENNDALRNQAQNLAQLAALVIIKHQCFPIISNPDIGKSAQTYIALLEKLKTLIPDVGSSTILDTISSNQISLEPQNPTAKKLTIHELLFATKTHLNLNHLSWYDQKQMQMLLPSRHLFQQLRFGQEDRHVYREIRKKNLKKDLFMARNVYDVQQFTKDGTSDLVFEQNEKNHYQRQIRDKISEKYNASDREKFNQNYYRPIEDMF